MEKIKKRTSWNKGRSHTQEEKQKISDGMKKSDKYKNSIKNPERGKKISKSKKGKIPYIMTDEIRKKMSDGRRGEKSPCYIKDRTLIKHQTDRNNPEYKQWRMKVYIRDNYKCKINNLDCHGRLEAHHILGFTDHPDLRYDVNNGITLCHVHHPRVRIEEKRLIPTFRELVSVSK